MKTSASACCIPILFLSILAVPALHASTDQGATTVVRTVNGYLMVVQVILNDQGPLDFLVDTGTNTTLIDPAVAIGLNLRPVDRMVLTTLPDVTPVARYYADTMRVGPASVSHLEILGAPMEELHALDSKIRGVLGMNFLLQFSFLMDYRHHRMEIFPFPESAAVPQGQRLRIRINDSRILLPASSDSALKGTWNLALDSGISGLLLFQGRTRLSELTCHERSCLVQVSTNGGTHYANTTILPEVEIAGNRILNQPVVVLKNELLNPQDPQDGLLPASFFKSVFFDRSNGTLVVEAK